MFSYPKINDRFFLTTRYEFSTGYRWWSDPRYEDLLRNLQVENPDRPLDTIPFNLYNESSCPSATILNNNAIFDEDERKPFNEWEPEYQTRLEIDMER